MKTLEDFQKARVNAGDILCELITNGTIKPVEWNNSYSNILTGYYQIEGEKTGVYVGKGDDITYAHCDKCIFTDEAAIRVINYMRADFEKSHRQELTERIAKAQAELDALDNK